MALPAVLHNLRPPLQVHVTRELAHFNQDLSSSKKYRSRFELNERTNAVRPPRAGPCDNACYDVDSPRFNIDLARLCLHALCCKRQC